MGSMRAPSETPAAQTALSLVSAEAVRTRAHRMLDLGLADALPHFRVHLDRLDTLYATVAEEHPVGAATQARATTRS